MVCVCVCVYILHGTPKNLKKTVVLPWYRSTNHHIYMVQVQKKKKEEKHGIIGNINFVVWVKIDFSS